MLNLMGGDMQRMGDYQYKGFTIAVMVWPSINDRFQGAFSIRRTIARLHVVSSIPVDRFALLYREGRELGTSCETDQDARMDAVKRAQTWIKTQAG
ncbi:hypothetical protein [Massilia phyllosphaerae]|uniref:hypothetical protein n=1 Tax=Massilia phyllosphaerae TaxID=3106034 RepID=UPI002B1CCD80|nr:hypothetical protein [Massilia sp. SGZ-792]